MKRVHIFGIIICGLIASGFGFFVYKYRPQFLPRTETSSLVLDYLPARDRTDIVQLFDENWYWLIASNDFSTEFMLDYGAPDRSSLYLGSLRFKIIRIDNIVVGLVAYYMHAAEEGRILFLVVKEGYRGKGYSELLMQAAIEELQKMGAARIWLLTRIQNVRAQKLYRRLGFKEFQYDPSGFLYFDYIP